MYISQKKRVMVAYLSYPYTGPRYVNVVVVINGYLYNFTVNIRVLTIKQSNKLKKNDMFYDKIGSKIENLSY